MSWSYAPGKAGGAELNFKLWTNQDLSLSFITIVEQLFVIRCKEICGIKTDLLDAFYQHRLILTSNTPDRWACENLFVHQYCSTNKERYYVIYSERLTTSRSSRTRCSRLAIVLRGNSRTITFHHLVGKSNKLQQVDQTNEHRNLWLVLRSCLTAEGRRLPGKLNR